MPPTMSQDDVGVCYGFSTTALLDHYRCAELLKDCSKKSELLAPLDVTSFYKKPNPNSPKNLEEGGRSSHILDNLKRTYPGDKKLAKEECVNFASLIHTSFVIDKNKTNEKMGWNYLMKKWNDFRANTDPQTKDCVSCMANNIKSQMQNLRASNTQIENALNTANTVEEFLYKAILPSECLNPSNMLNIPDYKIGVFPKDPPSNTSATALIKKVESLILNNIPVEMAICSQEPRGGICPLNANREAAGHSITISGVKLICNRDKTECKKMAKVQNSWGQGWQNINNDGWVELTKLAEASILFDTTQQITWIQNPNKVYEDKKLRSTGNTTQFIDQNKTFAKPKEFENYHGMWKCPGAVFQINYIEGCIPYRPGH
jgi:hypothetical protein